MHVIAIAVAGGRAKAAGAAAAKATAERLLGRQVEDGDRRVHVAIAVGLAEAGKLEEAMSLAQELDHPWGYYAVAVAQIEAGDVGAAKATTRSMPIGTWRNWACDGVVTALTKAGRTDEALAFARSLGDEYENCAYVAMCKAKASLGDIEGAKAALSRISLPKFKASAMCSIAQAQLAAGDLNEAYATVDQCVRIILEEHLYPYFGEHWCEELVAVCSSLAEAYASEGNADGYSKCIEAAKRLPTSYFANIAETQARTGDLAGASETIDAAREELASFELVALRCAGRGYAKTHDNLDAFIRSIKTLKEPYERGYAWLGIAEGLIQKQEEAKKKKGEQE
ncbi:MAG: hypothetical protein HQ592_00940 [Planctomycetes bacterium]|nr:hypothetical protein [Planctomycetota bacterium]